MSFRSIKTKDVFYCWLSVRQYALINKSFLWFFIQKMWGLKMFYGYLLLCFIFSMDIFKTYGSMRKWAFICAFTFIYFIFFLMRYLNMKCIKSQKAMDSCIYMECCVGSWKGNWSTLLILFLWIETTNVTRCIKDIFVTKTQIKQSKWLLTI